MLRILDAERVFEAAGLDPEGILATRASNGTPAEVRALTEAFVRGTLPGQAEQVADWMPALGRRDFRLLDVF
jgi:hypothetical protein